MISIIVPVYNVERYLDQCIQSIVSQTYADWELIIVDDGSTDGSAVIAKQWRDSDSRIIYYPKENGGVSSARNFGLKKAKGEYIMFVDGDDICHKHLLTNLEYMAKDGRFAFCQVHRFKETPIMPEGDFNSEVLITPTEIYTRLTSTGLLHFPCARLYRRDIINQYSISFDEKLALGEDLCFNLDYLENITEALHISTPLYFYRDTPNSLSKNIHADYTDIQLYLFDRKLNFVLDNRINLDYSQYAPGIVRDIALSILKSSITEGEKMESLEKLKHHRLMNYCKSKGKHIDRLFAKAVKHIPSLILIKAIR